MNSHLSICVPSFILSGRFIPARKVNTSAPHGAFVIPEGEELNREYRPGFFLPEGGAILSLGTYLDLEDAVLRAAGMKP